MAKQWTEIEHQKVYGYDEGNIEVRLETPLKTEGPWLVSMVAFGKNVFSTPFMQEGTLQDAMDIADKLVEDHMDGLKKDLKEDNEKYFAGLETKG